MYIYKKSITGKADIQKIWELYALAEKNQTSVATL